MIQYPYLQEQPSSRVTTDVFRGLNLGSRIGEGEFSEMENLTSDHFPVLAPRGQRGRIGDTTSPEAIFFVSGKGTFLIDNGRLVFIDVDGRRHTEDSSEGSFREYQSHQFALMGKELIVVPDMRHINIDNPTVSYDIGEKMVQKSGKITITLCNREGQDYSAPVVSPNPPTENLGNNKLWIDNSQFPLCLKQYKALDAEWITIPTTYLKLSGLVDNYFEQGDGIHISGLGDGANMLVTQLNRSYVIEHYSHGSIVISGILNETWEQDCSAHPVTIERKIPHMDFIVESGNRLWGCSRHVNEIYASKLGDFRNWNVFSGISTDSWVGNVGSPGSFTAAVNHGGYPVFYKEDMKHKIWPSSTGAHQITSTPCIGVNNSCENSVDIYGSCVLYLADGVYMDDGSGEVKISQSLEPWNYTFGCGAVHRDKYYLCAYRNGHGYELLVYDLQRKLWHREDGIHLVSLTSADERLYGAGWQDGGLWDLTGGRGTKEDTVNWNAVTGDLCQASGDHQYVSRVTVRLALDMGSRLDIYARYDHNPLWVKLGTVYGTGPDSFSLPVRPRRCDHLQLKLEGQGPGKVYAITRTFEKGSEYR